ncbi:hypothetical protein HBH70_074260 [Parastagonospora nodorum]|nr:hypothetical protein HBH52_024570 [Parastagonospora nodorum]KAH3997438.1 hypothetical protein HBI10_143790 [Parastagonospora nodorum]KAH4021140.1 hypothetical protein HBI13_112090 [Parastagonospora nodorum]KAH4037077.1 hypothetical protein HBI09_065580 [Parastagonospora nodorum]KAH4176522.1 hypothetical protein HBH43_060080 [Parastagonospora nodorum]
MDPGNCGKTSRFNDNFVDLMSNFYSTRTFDCRQLYHNNAVHCCQTANTTSTIVEDSIQAEGS